MRVRLGAGVGFGVGALWIGACFRPIRFFGGLFGLWIWATVMIIKVSVGVTLLMLYGLGWFLYGMFWITRELCRELQPYVSRWLAHRRARRQFVSTR
jgi:hypothetical protein